MNDELNYQHDKAPDDHRRNADGVHLKSLSSYMNHDHGSTGLTSNKSDIEGGLGQSHCFAILKSRREAMYSGPSRWRGLLHSCPFFLKKNQQSFMKGKSSWVGLKESNKILQRLPVRIPILIKPPTTV